MTEHLSRLIDPASVNDKGHYRWIRPLESYEQSYVDNELMMCQLDFRYACENYFKIQLASQSDAPAGWDELDESDDEAKSGGRIGLFLLNGMQLKLLERLARLEEACYEALARGAPVNGILLILHKARQLGACLKKGTLVLTADLKWVPIESVRVGDCLVSVDETHRGGKGAARKMRLAVVEGTRSLLAETFKVTMSDGRVFEATAEHRFLCRDRGGNAAEWRTVGEMHIGDFIRHVVHPWSEPTYEDGWFSGLLDGEGSLRGRPDAGGSEVCVSQVAGPVLDRASAYLRDGDYSFRMEVDKRKGGDSSKLGDKPVYKLVVNRISSIFRLLGKTQPSRFRGRIDWWHGKEIPNGDNLGGHWVEIVSIERAGIQEVYDLQTSTGTFVAEGLVSHNSILWQALGFHRINFYSHINGLTASIDDTSTQALFRRFERMWENLPPWMRAKIKRQERGTGWQMERDSVMELQSGKQDKDLGKGETWHFAHVTECAVFERPEDHFDEGLFPTIPYSLYTLYGMESTSKGKRGWWYDFVMSVMKGTAEDDTGAGRFDHFFAPFYLIDISDESRGQRSKYRIEAPIDWQPSGNTQLAMRRIYEGSEAVCGIPNVVLHRDVQYWYERTRNAYYKRGKLNVFLQNFPLDPHESFQHSSSGAFTSETIEKLENNCARYEPWPYTIISAGELSERQHLVSDTVRAHTVKQWCLAPMSKDELDRDHRGIIYLWEQPHERFMYSLGSDPTGGIPGWRRAFRTQNDINTDNGTIEIFRKDKPPVICAECEGRAWLPTASKGVLIECRKCDGRGRIGGQARQVAEFAAPVDAEELALYIYILGRVFRGNSELDECLAVVESNNTGILTIRKLQSVYEYTNLYQHESIDNAQSPRYTGGIGFVSSATSVPILHAWSRSVVMRRDIDIRSAPLVREMSDAIVKITGTSGESPEELAKAKTNAIVVRERFVVPAGGGRHDDRMTGAFLSWWGLFDRRESDPMDVGEFDKPPSKQLPDYASHDYTADEQQAAWNAAVEESLEDQDLSFGHYPNCSPMCRAVHPPEDLDEDSPDYDEDDPRAEYDPAY